MGAETSQPEPVEAQVAAAASVAGETPKGAEVFAVVMVCSSKKNPEIVLVLLLSSNSRIVSSCLRLVLDSTLFFPDGSYTPKDSREQMSMTR